MEAKAGAVKSISGKGIPEDNCGSKGGRIMKIKKDVKPQIQNLPALKIKYTLVVPLMGIVDTLTMLSFYRNPATDGNLFAKVFFIVFAVLFFKFGRGSRTGRYHTGLFCSFMRACF